jgi:hypothetical protein
MVEELKYIWDYVKIDEMSAINDRTGEVFFNLHWTDIDKQWFIRFPKWNGEMQKNVIPAIQAKTFILQEKVAELFNINESKLNEIEFTYTKPTIPVPEPPKPPVVEYPKNIVRAPYTIRVNNAEQEKQSKEFLGIEPSGDDLDTWLSKRDLAGLEQWKSYWTDKFTEVGMSFWISLVNDKFIEYKNKLIEPEPPVVETWWQKLIKITNYIVDFPRLIGLAPGAQALRELWDNVDLGKKLQEDNPDIKILELTFPWWFAMPETAIVGGLGKFGLDATNSAKVSKIIKNDNWIKSLEWMKANPIKAAKNFPKLNTATKAQMLKSLEKDKLAVSLHRELEAANHAWLKSIDSPFWTKLTSALRDPKTLNYSAGRIIRFMAAAAGAQFGLEWATKEGIIEPMVFPYTQELSAYRFNPTPERKELIEDMLNRMEGKIPIATDVMRGLGWIFPPLKPLWDEIAGTYDTQLADFRKEFEIIPIPKETGQLTVNSNIDNSDVYIDGMKVGTTPYVKDLDVGKYHILVTKFGYTSQELDVDIVKGATPKFNAQISLLTPPPTGKGTLDIAVEPTDAILEVAGHPEINKMGSYEVDVGTYTIKASKENYFDKSVTAIAKEAQITDVSIVLSKKPEELPPEEVKGTLTISVTPEDALIEVAGQEEITKAGVYDLSPGSYSVRASKDGFETKIKTAIVDEEKDTAISFTLAEITPPKPVTTKATIKITSEPTLADVYIDGEYAFTKTPYTVLLAEGAYFIRVQKDGYYPTEVEIEVEAGEVSELPLVLTKIVEPEIPPAPYYPQTPYYPTYVPDVPYVPDVVTTPPAEIAPYNYSNLYPETFAIPGPKAVSRPVEKELMINIETTDVKPWKGRIYSIALLDLSEPGAEILMLINDNEQLLIEEFLSIFSTINPSKLVGFKLIFDYRYIFAKMLLYRIQHKKFYDVGLRDVKQILDQVKEEFVYYPDKTGKLDDWGKALLGVGKYGSQELMLRKYISGDFDYVKEFQNRQIELTRDLYNLARLSMGEAFISSPSPATSPISFAPDAQITDNPVSTHNSQCPVCFAFIDKTTGKCPICAPVI